MAIVGVASPANAQTPNAAERPRAFEEVRKLLAEGKYTEAEALARKRLPDVEATHGAESVEAAEVLDVLVESLWRRGKRNAPADRVLAERAVAIKERALGPEHPAVALSLSGLAVLLRVNGDYAEARAPYERALAIREKALGAQHADVGRSLNSLANLLVDTGDFAGARPLYERSLAILEKNLGPEHPNVAGSLNNLANVLRLTGDYRGARPLYERSVVIREKILGAEHPDLAHSLNNLALLFKTSGDYAAARPLYERALAIREKALGPEHPDVALGLSNLANLFVSTGDHLAARPLHERALAIRERALGPEHPDFAMSLNNLAELYQLSGENAAAKPLLERSHAILENALGPEHSRVAESLNNLAGLLTDTDNSAAARPLYERAFAVRERTLGLEHPDVAQTAGDFAALLVDMGSPDIALDWALRAEDIGRAHLRLTARTLAEREALAYSAKRASGLHVTLSLAANGAKSIDRAWDALIRSRALVLDEMAARHRIVSEAGDPQVEPLALAVFSARQRLANLMVRGPGDKPEIYRRLLDEAQQEREKVERALAEKAASFQREQAKERIGLPEVTAALPPASTLVAFARYNHRHSPVPAAPRTVERPSVSLERTPSYMAFILPSARAKPAVVVLGAAAEIDRLVTRWKEEAAAGVLTSAGPQATELRYRSAGQELRQRVWDPLLPHLGKAKTVFVVPDGALNLVSLASLPVGESKYLVQTGPSLHYLSAERDLVSDPRGASGAGLLAVGGPAFDQRSLFAALVPEQPVPSVQGPQVAAPAGVTTAVSVFRGQRSSCGDFDAMQFGALPSTVQEADAVTSLWSSAGKDPRTGSAVVRLTEAEATEAAFKEKAPGRRVLHLATHGFFLGERCPSATDAQPEARQADRPGVGGENPLLLSGLAFAGANHRSAAGAGEDDGILTAEEIAALDLSSVEWAVLSACDTGVGEVRAGEGVFGLRRAFQVAGARTLIMSLWPQDDESAQRWMEALYRARLVKRLSTAEAVRRASLERLRDRRKNGESTHPFFWAGFVAAGDWR